MNENQHSISARLAAVILLVALILPAMPVPPAMAVGETSTRFGVFVPPNGSYSYRDSAQTGEDLQNVNLTHREMNSAQARRRST